MTRSLLLAAALAAGSPALAEYPDILSGPNFRDGRPFVYFGYDDRWGPRVFNRDDGYFQGRGAGVSAADGKARFDYDRDYPYDIPAGWSAGRPELGFVGNEAMAEPTCSAEPVRDRRSGERTTVRVCR